MLRRIVKKAFANRKAVLCLLAISCVAAGFDIGVPIIMQRVIDRMVKALIAKQALQLQFLFPAAAAILVATLLSRWLRNIYDYKLFRSVTKLEDFFRNQGYDKFVRLHAKYHHNTSSGQIISKIDRGGTGIYVILNDIIGQNLFVPAIYFTAILGIFLVRQPLLAFIVFLPLPIYLVLVQKWAQEVYAVDRDVNERFELASKVQHDVASNVITVKRFCQEDAEVRSQLELREAAREIQYGAEKLWIKIDLLQTSLAAIGRVAVLMVAGYRAMRQEISIGEFTLFLSLQSMVYAPMFQLSVLFPRLRRNMARTETLFELIDEPIDILDAPEARELAPLKEGILFDNVSFRYSEKQHRAVRRFTLRIPCGSKTALVGRSGSGKTTFVNLLSRVYDPSEGAIYFDGTDISKVTQKSLRNQIGGVPQEIDLFSRSVLENIRYGRPDATKEEVEAAAKLAFAHNFILELSDGYDTVVGERGMKLSGGQRQRIGIARAIVKDPRIFVLDESTNALDSESESIVKEAIASAMAGRTTIAIAHRLSTILDADQIVVFDHGRMEAAGSHAELLIASPIYKRLYDIQFQE